MRKTPLRRALVAVCCAVLLGGTVVECGRRGAMSASGSFAVAGAGPGGRRQRQGRGNRAGNDEVELGQAGELNDESDLGTSPLDDADVLTAEAQAAYERIATLGEGAGSATHVDFAMFLHGYNAGVKDQRQDPSAGPPAHDSGSAARQIGDATYYSSTDSAPPIGVLPTTA